jgi:hypothetical protein
VSCSSFRSSIIEIRWLERDSLAIAFAMAFRLVATFAHRPLPVALDPTLTASQTSDCYALAGEFSPALSVNFASIGTILRRFVVLATVGRVVPDIGGSM